ncbi:MAG: hypothetical protein ACFCGT_11075 [Sandaracinaceae bacterium]
MRTWHILTPLGLFLAGCFLSFEPRPAGDVVPPTTPAGPDLGAVSPDAGPATTEAPPDAGPACAGLPAPELRFRRIGDAPCDRASFADGRLAYGLAVSAAPELEGVRLDFLTSLERDRDYRCQIEVRGLGTAMAEGQPDAWGEWGGAVVQARASDLLILGNVVCDGFGDCLPPILLWVGRVGLPGEGPYPEQPSGNWVRLDRGDDICRGPWSRCTQGLVEVDVELRLDRGRSARLLLVPGVLATAPLDTDVGRPDRLSGLLFDTPTDCGPADGSRTLGADLALWQSYETPPTVGP